MSFGIARLSFLPGEKLYVRLSGSLTSLFPPSADCFLFLSLPVRLRARPGSSVWLPFRLALPMLRREPDRCIAVMGSVAARFPPTKEPAFFRVLFLLNGHMDIFSYGCCEPLGSAGGARRAVKDVCKVVVSTYNSQLAASKA